MCKIQLGELRLRSLNAELCFFCFIHRKMFTAACQHKACFQGVSRFVLRAQSLWLS